MKLSNKTKLKGYTHQSLNFYPYEMSEHDFSKYTGWYNLDRINIPASNLKVNKVFLKKRRL